MITEILLLVWMFLSVALLWENYKLKRKAQANKYSGYMAGYYTALRGRGMSKGEAVRATKRHIEEHDRS